MSKKCDWCGGDLPLEPLLSPLYDQLAYLCSEECLDHYEQQGDSLDDLTIESSADEELWD
ncbi:MAG: hypothetical protein ACM37W_14575 [Actinomycetota bacterium]